MSGRPPKPISRKTPSGRLGARIRAARERIGKTGAQCATEMGVSPMAWCDWEHGRVNMPVSRLGPIARVLGVAAGELVG
jgi:transcriptional regulator with XRE-family HTH domain